MKTIVLTLALTAFATGAVAQPRASTLDMSCGQARGVVASQGARGSVLGTGGYTYDRFVSNRNFCEINETISGPLLGPHRRYPAMPDRVPVSRTPILGLLGDRREKSGRIVEERPGEHPPFFPIRNPVSPGSQSSDIRASRGTRHRSADLCNKESNGPAIRRLAFEPYLGSDLMPRFFFNVRDGYEVDEDDEGIELPDFEAARAEAYATVEELREELAEDAARIELEILDDTGRRLPDGAVHRHSHARRR